MKKRQGIDKEIKKLKTQLTQLKQSDKTRSMGVLLNQETIIRKKMKIIQHLFDQLGEVYDQQLYQDYLRLLNEVSEQILNLYNEENETEYR